MTDRELMHQALDALEYLCETTEAESVSPYEAITALRDRLAQPEQELMIDCPRCGHCCPKSNQEPVVLMDAPLLLNGQPLYTTPPQRPWVGLTDEEIAEVEDQYIVDYRIPAGSAWNFAKDIEAKIRSKNQ